MKIYIKILIGFLGAVAAASLLFFLLPRPVEGITDRDSYRAGEMLDISVKNNLGRAICFSSCYPYLIESRQKFGVWEQYRYDDCPEAEAAVNCIPPQATKKFRLALDDAQVGLNRLKLAVCENCAPGGLFKADLTIYSNIFKIDN